MVLCVSGEGPGHTVGVVEMSRQGSKTRASSCRSFNNSASNVSVFVGSQRWQEVVQAIAEADPLTTAALPLTSNNTQLSPNLSLYVNRVVV